MSKLNKTYFTLLIGVIIGLVIYSAVCANASASHCSGMCVDAEQRYITTAVWGGQGHIWSERQTIYCNAGDIVVLATDTIDGGTIGGRI